MNVKGWLETGRGGGGGGGGVKEINAWVGRTTPTHSAVRVLVAQRTPMAWLLSWSSQLHHSHW